MRTRSGTIIEKGIEYKFYPPPPVLVKVMKEKHAKNLREHGAVRLTHADVYRAMENQQLGDCHDSRGMLTMEGHEYHTSTVNPVFLFSMSIQNITHKRISEIAESEGYDCLLTISNPEVFFQRIREALLRRSRKYWVHCGKVKYNRGVTVSKNALNSQQFNHNIFQKSHIFRMDKEYRLSVSNLSLHPRQQKYINLAIGKCTRIVTIEKLR